jgi:hypothetical protein
MSDTGPLQPSGSNMAQPKFLALQLQPLVRANAQLRVYGLAWIGAQPNVILLKELKKILARRFRGDRVAKRLLDARGLAR